MDNKDWNEILREIKSILEIYREKLSSDAIDAVEHYLNHDEFEMGFEGLCLELLSISDFLPEHRLKCQELARTLGLDKESVFDAEFWKKLSAS